MYVYCNRVSLHVRVLNNVLSTVAQAFYRKYTCTIGLYTACTVLQQNNKDTQEIQM